MTTIDVNHSQKILVEQSDRLPPLRELVEAAVKERVLPEGFDHDSALAAAQPTRPPRNIPMVHIGLQPGLYRGTGLYAAWVTERSEWVGVLHSWDVQTGPFGYWDGNEVCQACSLDVWVAGKILEAYNATDSELSLSEVLRTDPSHL